LFVTVLSTGLFLLCSLLGEKSPFTFGQAEISDESSRAQRKLECEKILRKHGSLSCISRALDSFPERIDRFNCNTDFPVNSGIHSRDWLHFKNCDKNILACTEKLQQGLAGLAEAAHFLQFSETVNEELIQVIHSSSLSAATMFGRTFADRQLVPWIKGSAVVCWANAPPASN
jgi:hypothetical protein